MFTPCDAGGLGLKSRHALCNGAIGDEYIRGLTEEDGTGKAIVTDLETALAAVSTGAEHNCEIVPLLVDWTPRLPGPMLYSAVCLSSVSQAYVGVG